MRSLITCKEEEQKPPFRPFVLSISVETLEDALVLRALGSVSDDLSEAIKENALHVAGISQDQIEKVLNNAFEKLHKYLEQRGDLYV